MYFQWHRTLNTQETDGFQVKRAGDQNVKCTVLLMLDYQVHESAYLLHRMPYIEKHARGLEP